MPRILMTILMTVLMELIHLILISSYVSFIFICILLLPCSCYQCLLSYSPCTPSFSFSFSVDLYCSTGGEEEGGTEKSAGWRVAAEAISAKEGTRRRQEDIGRRSRRCSCCCICCSCCSCCGHGVSCSVSVGP